MSPDDAFVHPDASWLPRLVVIDGCNVGRSSCGPGREAVSCAGLLSVVRWLLLRDFECVIFLPVVYNNPMNSNATHVEVLSKIEEMGLVTFTPARASSGDRRAFTNYDDLYLTTLAERHGGCVLSSDQFKDILAQPNYSEFHDVITTRVIDIRFLSLTHDVVHFGDDLFFRSAPELFILEDVSTRAASIARKIFCSPDDPHFTRVQTRRAGFTPNRRKKCLNMCDDLIYEICEREGIRPLRLLSLPALQPRRPPSERNLPHLEELQIVCDESVWQPGDSVTMDGHNGSAQLHCYFEERTAEEEDPAPVDDSPPLIVFSDDDDDEEDASIDLQAAAPLPPNPRQLFLDPIDPFLLMSRQEDVPLELDQIEAVIEESPRDQPTTVAASAASGDAVIPGEKQELLEQLKIIFPRDVVECVLAMNASSNLDYLAEQCLLHMNQ